MTTTLEKQLDTNIDGTRIWSYPCCYMVDGIDEDTWCDIRWNLADSAIFNHVNETLLSVPELNMLVEENFKGWNISYECTKNFLMDVYNEIDAFEGFVIFRKS